MGYDTGRADGVHEPDRAEQNRESGMTMHDSVVTTRASEFSLSCSDADWARSSVIGMQSLKRQGSSVSYGDGDGGSTGASSVDGVVPTAASLRRGGGGGEMRSHEEDTLQHLSMTDSKNVKGKRKGRVRRVASTQRSSLVGRDNRSSFAFDTISPERFPKEWEIFRTLDGNQDGFIEFENLQEMLESVGELGKLSKLAEALKCSSDKVLDFSDFVLAFHNANNTARNSLVSAVQTLPGATSVMAEKAFTHSLEHGSPMLVVPFQALQKCSQLPRSSDGVTEKYVRLRHKVVFVSFRWLGAMKKIPEPDDSNRTVFKTILKGVQEIIDETGWDESAVAIWCDYACVDQNNPHAKAAAIKSLLGFIARSETMLILGLGDDGRPYREELGHGGGTTEKAHANGLAGNDVEGCDDNDTASNGRSRRKGRSGVFACCFGAGDDSGRNSSSVSPMKGEQPSSSPPKPSPVRTRSGTENGRGTFATVQEEEEEEEGANGDYAQSSPTRRESATPAVLMRRGTSFRMKAAGTTSIARMRQERGNSLARRKSRVVIPVFEKDETEPPAQWPPYDVTDLRLHWESAWRRLEWLAYMCISEIREQPIALYVASLAWPLLRKLSTGSLGPESFPAVEWEMRKGQLQLMLPSKGATMERDDIIAIRQLEFNVLRLYHMAVVDVAVSNLIAMPASGDMWLNLSWKGMNSAAVTTLSEHLKKLELAAAAASSDAKGFYTISLCTSLLVDHNRIGDFGLSRLINVFPYMRLQELNVSCCGLTAAGLEVIRDSALSGRLSLLALRCSRNDFGSGSTIREDGPADTGYGAQCVVEIIQSQPLRLLDIERCGFGCEDIITIVEGIPRSSLESISINHNAVLDSAAKSIANVLRNKGSRLRTLHASGCLIGRNGAFVIASAIANETSVIDLDLSSNDMQERGIKNIAVSLSSPRCTLSRLSLASCSITEYPLVCLGQALSTNTSLRALDISGSELSEEGFRSLCSSMRMSSTLAVLSANECGLHGRPVVDAILSVMGRDLEAPTSVTEMFLVNNAFDANDLALLRKGLNEEEKTIVLV